MFGITFVDNSDLRRLLLDYQFNGFALRKDFPVTGYIELFYFDYESRVIYTPVTLIQEPKQFQIKAS
jgi:NADH-quinone oxidoreductase subunit C